MHEYICSHIIPGCTHKETGDTPEAAREKAIAHLEARHGMGHIDDDVATKLSSAINMMTPR